MIKTGDKVCYHSIIGGPVTSRGHVVDRIFPEPNNFGCQVAFISGKSGVVALDALSKDEDIGVPE